MYDQNNYVKEFITSNFTYCYDGDCNSISEYYLYEKKYTAPTSALTYPPLYCNVCNGKYCSNYGWDEGTLIWCYDTNSNGQYCDSGDRIEPYLVVKCGVDADCGTGKTCKKPTLENTSTYRCA
jgi:hypothetical protein